jgi:hypothetical protein
MKLITNTKNLNAMLCENYNNLSHYDKMKYIGELLHACQSDNYFFSIGENIIQSAKDSGLFEGVIILPEQTKSYNEAIKESGEIH